jgi:hypothetical protein
METLGADSDDSQINSKPIARPHLPNKMGVVFEIHSPRFATTMAGIAKPDSGIECVAGVIEHSDKVSDVHMLIAVYPFGARDRLITGRSQLLNLF